MPSKITQALKDYLNNNDKVQLAHLVRIELPGELASFAYYTDYSREIQYDGQEFVPGKVKNISDVKQSNRLSAHNVTIKITGASSEEVDRAVRSQQYLNKKISIWRVVLDNATGEIIPYYADGSTLLFFEGTITEVSIDENRSATSRGESTISWKCANEFYDLERVNGRLTDDESHRGLIVDQDGDEVPSNAAKRFEYQTDLGFFHANKSVNILAKYQGLEQAYKLKKKSSGLFGIKKSYDLVEYWETVEKEVDMRFNLAAKNIPTIYGVQKTQGIPIFADTLLDDPSTVYVVYAFCEGEIDGFLDIWMEDKPLVCNDTNDADERACFGVKRGNGDTISVATPTQDPTAPSVHGQEYIVQDGLGQVSFWTFHGKRDQTACSKLVDIAAEGNFYLQNNGPTPMGPEYWDNRYRLLDTAYVVAEFKITDQRTEIPTIYAEIQGRKVAVYDENGLVRDDRTSTNPAWQMLDYLNSPIFGAAVGMDRIDLNTFVEVANLLDTVDNTYELSWVPFWRYIGWEDNTTEANKAILQTNPLLNGETSLFKNMKSMLEQAESSLNIIEGKYALTVESLKDPVADLTEADLVGGRLQVSDITSKEKYNTVQADIRDPGIGWESNDIIFFNADFKAEDSQLEKKANISFPHITNYYCARALAERVLKKSRYNREVSITVPYKYVDLPINSPVTLTYERFGWDKKQFLIRETVWQSTGKVKLKLREYEDGVFINSPQSDIGDSQIPEIGTKVLPPRDLNYRPSIPGDPEGVNGYLRWLPSFSPDVTYYAINYTGVASTITVNASSTDEPSTYIELPIDTITEDRIYTFEVRAVAGNKGLSSSPAILSLQLGPDGTKNLTMVTGFDLVNNIIGDETVWKGAEVSLQWNPIFEEDFMDNIYYNLEFWDGDFETGDLIRALEIRNAYAYIYDLPTNKSDYLAAKGTKGMFRQLGVRIRAESDDGAKSVGWTKL